MLTAAILSTAKKREYAKYTYTRTADIWPTREDLIAYEEALALEAEVDLLLEGTTFNAGARGRSTTSKTPVVKTEEEGHESERVKNARKVKEILETIRPQWDELVTAKSEADPPRKGLERFDCGECFRASTLPPVMCERLTRPLPAGAPQGTSSRASSARARTRSVSSRSSGRR